MEQEATPLARPFKMMIHPQDKNRHPEWPKYLPMNFIKKFEERIRYNHSQTPEELHKRGGLTPREMYAAISDMSIPALLHDPINDEEAMDVVLNELEIYYREGGLSLDEY